MNTQKPVTAILIGAGQRGAEAYGSYALQYPEQIRFIAVAEPDLERRKRFAKAHHISEENTFASWEELLSRGKFADAAFVTTQDQQHTAPAVSAMQAGYHVLLEKPMAVIERECKLLVEVARQTNRQLHICHVLRYTPHFQKMNEIIQSGVLGDIIDIAHRENVSYWHMAHSFVRGNWNNEAKSSPMILAKCCHDFDILLWLLGERCIHLSSIGSLAHFRPENAPPGAPERCLDGCPAADTCPYEANFIYTHLIPLWHSFGETAHGFNRIAVAAHQKYPALTRALTPIIPSLRQITGYWGWPRSVAAKEPTMESLQEALQTGPYGLCVYRCDNDVVDHQVVSMMFESGTTVTLTMHGHSNIEGRSTRIEGTRGQLEAFFGIGGGWIEVRQHRSGSSKRYTTGSSEGHGHGGGDQGLMNAFVKSLNNAGEQALTTADQSLESHLMAFAAEKARLEERVVRMDEMR